MLAVARRLAEAARTPRAGRWRTWGRRAGWASSSAAPPWRSSAPGASAAAAKRAAGFEMDAAGRPRRRPPLRARARRLRLAPHPAHARDAPPHRRRRAGAHEAHGDPRQHRARPDRRPGRARRRAARGAPRRRGARRHRPRAAAPRSPAVRGPNLLVVPHIGSATTTARAAMADRAVDNLLAALDGKPMPYPVRRADAQAPCASPSSTSARTPRACSSPTSRATAR